MQELPKQTNLATQDYVHFRAFFTKFVYLITLLITLNRQMLRHLNIVKLSQLFILNDYFIEKWNRS